MKDEKNKKRKVCFVITSFIHYSRSLLILDELQKDKNIDLNVVVGGTALLHKYSSQIAYVRDILQKKGFKTFEVYFNLEGDEPVVKAKTIGLGIIEFANVFHNLKPDLVVLRGDRFEVLSAATVATNMNIPIAHLEGGDLSGSVDESVRHAITKLSHIHFVTNNDSKNRVLAMGENPKYVFNFGSPEIEVVQKITNGKNVDFNFSGSGYIFDPKKEKFLMVMYHPVTTNLNNLIEETNNLILAIHEMKFPVIWFWPNFDAGAEEISKQLRVFSNKVKDHKIHFSRYLPPEHFLGLLKHTSCLVGNSSAGVKESSILGVPVVNIGSRQNGRLKTANVTEISNFDLNKIKQAIKKQIEVGRYKPNKLFLVKDTSKKIAKTIASAPLYIQKKFFS